MWCTRPLSRKFAIPALAGLTALAMAGSFDPLNAQGRPGPRHDPYGQGRAQGTPLFAVVALNEQRITIYDASGKMLQAPISSGQTGYETPAGIFSIVQKKEVHESNLYEDGKMPFMQRITWTGIALHAGALPGHPASHGCVRMPLPFAERLFPMTDLGMRVVIVREDIVPADIAHPTLFGQARTAQSDAAPPGSPRYLGAMKSLAAAKASEADAAARRANEARRVAARKAAETVPATRALRAAEANYAKAKEVLKAAEGDYETAALPEGTTDVPPERVKQSEAAKAKAERARARASETQSQLEAAQAQAQSRNDAASRAADEAKAAEAASVAAADAADEAKRKTQPVSVFVSRKTQRFYIRQAFQPLYEGPIAIRNPDAPIGTYVFTALGHLNNGADVRWSVVSMYKSGGASAQPAMLGARARNDARHGDPAPADVAGAKAALDRFVLPPDALEKISGVVLAGSSMIVSDEGPSVETGKDTDFVVVMSGEPQGALKIRKREPLKSRDDDDYSPFGNSGRRNMSPFKGFPFFN